MTEEYNTIFNMKFDTPRKPVAMDATIGVKFAQQICIIDEWWLVGGTKWSRTLCRLKHPIIYGKRGLRILYRMIRRIFIKDRITPLKNDEKR